MATEKKTASILIDESTIEKVTMVCPTIGLVYSGMSPDARLLINKARKSAQAYYRTYHEYPPASQLTREIAAVMQEYTQSGGVRPFGVSLLVAGFDEKNGPALYQVDPSGSYWAWKATAIGKNMVNAKSFLEKRYWLLLIRYDETMDLEDAIHNAILTLKEGFEGFMNENNIEIGVFSYKTKKFEKLSPMMIKDYLMNL